MAQDSHTIPRHDDVTFKIADHVSFTLPGMGRPIDGTVVRITTGLDPRDGTVAVKGQRGGKVRTMCASKLNLV